MWGKFIWRVGAGPFISDLSLLMVAIQHSIQVEMRNMDTGDLFVFHANAWFSKKRDDGRLVRDIVATFKGKKQLKRKKYKREQT